MYDNKIAIVVANDLTIWQKLNVTTFLASSVAIAFPEIHGKPLVNISGRSYLPFLKQPVMIYKSDNDVQLKRVFLRAKDRNLHIGIYTRELFATKNEEENLIAIAKHTDEEMDLVGIIIYGENKKVDKAFDGLKLHP